jgi:hypothetical protein
VEGSSIISILCSVFVGKVPRSLVFCVACLWGRFLDH